MDASQADQFLCRSIPRVGSFPTPYSAWPSHYKDITPALYYALAAGLALHM